MSAPFTGRSRRRHADEPLKSQFINQLLSLFIMLVAFFIVLNSISISNSEKSKSARQSLGGQFAGSEDQDKGFLLPLHGNETTAGDVIGLNGVQGGGDSFDSRVSGMFTSIIPAGKAVQKTERGALYLHMTQAEFDAGLDKNTDGPFSQALGAVIRNDDEGQPYHMAITINLGGNPAEIASQTPEATAVLAAKFDRIAAQIEKAGVPATLFSVGAGEGDKDTVDLIFRPLMRVDPSKGSKLSEGQ